MLVPRVSLTRVHPAAVSTVSAPIPASGGGTLADPTGAVPLLLDLVIV
jgi:hypothetical protein